jgi:hypothetical protein
MRGWSQTVTSIGGVMATWRISLPLAEAAGLSVGVDQDPLGGARGGGDDEVVGAAGPSGTADVG